MLPRILICMMLVACNGASAAANGPEAAAPTSSTTTHVSAHAFVPVAGALASYTAGEAIAATGTDVLIAASIPVAGSAITGFHVFARDTTGESLTARLGSTNAAGVNADLVGSSTSSGGGTWQDLSFSGFSLPIAATDSYWISVRVLGVGGGSVTVAGATVTTSP